MKYLLILQADQTGYWDTSGYCHWSKGPYFSKQTWELDNIDGIIEDIGKFKSEYPDGDVYLYKVEECDYWEKDKDISSILDAGEDKAKELTIKRDEEKRQEKLKIAELEAERRKARELVELERLKSLYEKP
jgi:hypothetical protein